MPDVKVTALATLAEADLNPAADFLLVSDMSASASKKMTAAGMVRAALPYLSTAFDFLPGSLPLTISFTRASTGYRYNSSGVLVPESADVARFQYDPATLLPRGLLVEGATTNLITYSEQFNNAAWSKGRSFVTPDVEVAPNGNTTADALIEDTSGGSANSRYVTSSAVSFVSGGSYVFSVYAKQNGRNWIALTLPSAAFTTNIRAWFDLAAGVVGTVNAGITAFMEDAGNGWYRCTVIALATITASAGVTISISTADGDVDHAGDGVSGYYLWGASVHQETELVSYVQTVAATVARSTDVALIANPVVLTDQCYIVRARTPRRTANSPVLRTLFQIDNGTNTHYRAVRWDSDGTIRMTTRYNGTTVTDLSLGSVAADTDFSVAVRFTDNNFAGSLNGGAVVKDLTGTNPMGLIYARLGRNGSTSYWNSTIKYFESRRTASDAELEALSA